MKSQNIIIYHKILPVNYKKNLKIQRDFDFLWPLHPAFRVQSSMFQLLLRNSWGEHKAMNLAFWWIILKSFSPSFYQNVKINSFFFPSPLPLLFPILTFPEKRERDHCNRIYWRFLGVLPSLWNTNTPPGKGVSCFGYISLVPHCLWCLHSCFCHFPKNIDFRKKIFFSPPDKVIYNCVLISKVFSWLYLKICQTVH